MRKIKFKKRLKIKSNKSAYEILQFKLKRLRIIFYSFITITLISVSSFLYFHYDYIIFRNLIARNYILTETLDSMFYEHLGFIPNNYSRYFDNLVISVFTSELSRIDNDRYTFLYTPSHLELVQNIRQQRAAQSELYKINYNTVFLKILNTERYVQEFIFQNIDYISEFENIIIDLRGNSGGRIAVMQAIANLFLDNNASISYEVARFNIFSSSRRSRGPAVLEFANIIILQDERTASSAEMLISALSENLNNVTTIGATTFGKGIGQITVPLRRGFAINATVIVMKSPLGNQIHNIGIPPDIEFEGDNIIEFALNLIE